MNKVLHINISGQVIAIEAPAYEALQAYLASLRAYFAAEEGCEEIINDIEGRIAEMLSAKIAAGAVAVTTADVDEVATAMGRPADFARDAGDANDTSHGAARPGSGPSDAPPRAERPQRRLYRDTKDRWVAGVCSGAANYLNIDATLVRILFAVVTFGGFGLGFLIYFALWLLLPEQELEDTVTSRLFRNPDDKVIGGVASGIAAYLGKDPKWVRLILVAPLAINALLALVAWVIFLLGGDVAPALVSSSLISTFVFAYVVMWVVLPEAGTPYERMRMRGEPIDINAIKQRVQAGLAVAKQRLETAGSDLRRKSQQWQTQGRAQAHAWQSAGGAADAAGAASAADAVDAEWETVPPAQPATNIRATRSGAGVGLGHVTRVIAQVIMLSMAGLFAFSLFAALLTVVVGVAAWWWPARNFLWSSSYQEALVWSTIALFLFVPALAFVLWLFRRGVGAPPRAALGWTFAGLWTLGWVSLMLLVVDVARDLQAYETVEQVVAAPTSGNGDRLLVKVSQPAPIFSGWWASEEIEGFDLDEHQLKLSLIHVGFKKSEDAAFHVTLKKHSAGRSEADARARAERTQYHVAWQPGELDLASAFAIMPAEKFRGQRIHVVVDVPIGKRVRLDESVRRRLASDEHVVDGRYDLDSNQDYVMGGDGVLQPLAAPLDASTPVLVAY